MLAAKAFASCVSQASKQASAYAHSPSPTLALPRLPHCCRPLAGSPPSLPLCLSPIFSPPQHLHRLLTAVKPWGRLRRSAKTLCSLVHPPGCKLCTTCHFCRQKTTDTKVAGPGFDEGRVGFLGGQPPPPHMCVSVPSYVCLAAAAYSPYLPHVWPRSSPPASRAPSPSPSPSLTQTWCSCYFGIQRAPGGKLRVRGMEGGRGRGIWCASRPHACPSCCLIADG